MYTFPATKDTIPALDLSLKLLDQAVHGDLLKDSDIEFTKNFLIGAFPFKIDTATGIVSAKLHNHFVGLPEDHIETYLKRVAAITPEMAKAAAKKYLNSEDVHIVVLCTANDLKAEIKDALRAKNMKVVPYDQL